jgi:DNA-binding beta-propeller fold protein YncE
MTARFPSNGSEAAMHGKESSSEAIRRVFSIRKPTTPRASAEGYIKGYIGPLAGLAAGLLASGVLTVWSGFGADALPFFEPLCSSLADELAANFAAPTPAGDADSPTGLSAYGVAESNSPDRSDQDPRGTATRVYVPNVASSTVQVIDPIKAEVIGRFRVGVHPHHIVPSWDFGTLWITSIGHRRRDGSVTPIDSRTGKFGVQIPVDDPYNMYFTIDGQSAIIVVEGMRRLDFRDPHSMELQSSISTPGCAGINHADFSIDGRFAIFSCEFAGALVKIDMVGHTVVGYLSLPSGSMPQDVRASADGATFYVADMHANGVHLIDGDSFQSKGFVKTGIGTHGLIMSRDGSKLYVSNRGTNSIRGRPKGPGSMSVIDLSSNQIEHTWPIAGGGSPDMGALSPDGRELWVSGRFDNVVYAMDTTTGETRRIKVDGEPHGVTVWPQPGRFSLGHTGNIR